ncbi:UDP-N-acetylmuramyl pentapeptide phosphotransferase [uncultured Desulfobacter sp.]|uniref:UDP-N-acetylmuramyl pentapeptide phosphotransferase n=1 Tax=uncultured Desulfobacter sp. TaxID=240139 RepID=UPI002AAC3C5F|nr:UDP-N-acetylmuramyl pentapeptide phosphotransferase [uncultured Desulfobacter sp.]
MKESILVFLCFLLGLGGAWMLILFGEKMGMMDLPNHRSSHNRKVCKGAGIGILFAILVASLFLKIAFFLWLPALVISIASLWGGDRYKFTAKKRLFVHFCCSLCFLLFLSKPVNIVGPFCLLNIPLSIFIVGTSNFYNFMDGIDGIAGITGLVGFLLLAGYGKYIKVDANYITFCVCISASCIGFLSFNFPKARVFLGDIGSILIGFVFSCLTIFMTHSAIDFFIMAGFMFPFYVDELSTMIIRLKDKELLFKAHRRHIYQLMVNEMKAPHWIVSAGYGMFQVIVGLSLISVKSLGMAAIFSIYLISSIVFIAFSCFIRSKALRDVN